MNETCPSCGRSSAKVRELKDYRYSESGLDNIVLCGGVFEIRCSCRDDTFVFIESEQQLLQCLVIGLLSSSQPLNGSAQAFLRKSCDLTQARLAKLLGISRRETIAERETKSEPMSLESEFHFRAVILSAFWEHVRDGRHSYLAPQQLLWLAEIRDDFLKHARRSSKKRANLRIRRSAENLWAAPIETRAASSR
jgi:hypothetical protein